MCANTSRCAFFYIKIGYMIANETTFKRDQLTYKLTTVGHSTMCTTHKAQSAKTHKDKCYTIQKKNCQINYCITVYI